MRAALDHVAGRAAARASGARRRIAAVLGTAEPPDRLLEGIRGARVTLNFHPDRLLANGVGVAAGLDRAGRYRSQFETGISAGSLTAVPGGDRERWEHTLFGGVYDGAPAWARPVYGGLNVARHADGACPRFGSCHLRLRPALLARSTFCAGDSYAGPTDLGTLDEFTPVLAALLEAAAGGQAPGTRLDVAALHVVALVALLTASSPSAAGRPGRVLDDYVEAQVHGGVDLSTDVEALAADPAFRGTPTGRDMERLATRHGLVLEWSGGFTLDVDAVPSTFRGPEIPPFARLVHERFGEPCRPLDAEVVGRAAAALPADPTTLRLLKQLWHVLVHDGRWDTGS